MATALHATIFYLKLPLQETLEFPPLRMLKVGVYETVLCPRNPFGPKKALNIRAEPKDMGVRTVWGRAAFVRYTKREKANEWT
jgi:hypothetical protein